MDCHSEFLPDGYESGNDLASMHTLEKLERMIRACSLDEKEVLLRKLDRINEAEAIEIMAFLKGYMPKMGTEAVPHTIFEQGEAIRNAVEKDDFYEERRKK